MSPWVQRARDGTLPPKSHDAFAPRERVTANIADEVIERRITSPSGGSTETTTVVNVHVTGTTDRSKAVAEAYWVTWRERDGDVLDGPRLVGVQDARDGLDEGTWLVSHRITTLRYS